MSKLSVREIQIEDIQLISDYWLTADETHLLNMGVDIAKRPSRQQLEQNLTIHLATPIEQRISYCLIWLEDEIPVGHSNTNPTIFGEQGFMHLHLWNTISRKRGMGVEFVKLSLPLFFEELKLKKIISEPYALNPAPNKTLPKAGFDFIKEYVTTPGSLNFEQTVNRWEISIEKFKSLQKSRSSLIS
jgi:ribosomal-protein-alanine N-acetyltransferase